MVERHEERLLGIWAFPRPNIFIISFLFLFGLLFSIHSPCQAQTSPKDKVDALYKRYVQLNKQGRYQEALRYAKELVPSGEEAFGKDHPNVATFLNNLAYTYNSLGDYAKAEPLYMRSLAIVEKALGPDGFPILFFQKY